MRKQSSSQDAPTFGRLLVGVVLIGIGYAAITVFAARVFGNGPSLVIGVVLAGTVVWVFRLLDKMIARASGLSEKWRVADWVWSTALGILLMHGSWFLSDAFYSMVVIIHGGAFDTPILSFIGSTVFITAGFFLGGYALGRLVPSQALYASALGTFITSFMELIKTWSGQEFDKTIQAMGNKAYESLGYGPQVGILEDVRVTLIVYGVVRVLIAAWGAQVGSRRVAKTA